MLHRLSEMVSLAKLGHQTHSHRLNHLRNITVSSCLVLIMIITIIIMIVSVSYLSHFARQTRVQMRARMSLCVYEGE